MEWFEALALGLVQGVTEFLPISSTAHLQVVTKVLGWTTVGAKPFVATIQFGSVVAVIIYFWHDIVHLLSGAFKAVRAKDWRNPEWQAVLGITIGTIPVLIGGLILKKLLNDDTSSINSLTTIACTSIGMALLLGLAEQVGSRKRGFDRIRAIDGLLMGLGQAIALVPGASRSGSTLTTGLLMGFDRSSAARFSFLLGIPALTIATLYEFFKEALGQIDLGLVLVGTFSAFVFSYLSIAWLIKFLQVQNTWVFVIYRLLFGAGILTALALGFIHN
jgi:undecaprenyl-diphosphatase